MMAETYVLQALQRGFQQVQQNPALLDDILSALNANELAAAKGWFGNLNLTAANIANKNRLIIAPGFPAAPEQLPFIGVTVAEGGQIEGQTGIGLQYYTVSDDAGNVVNARGARFNGSIKATIFTPNADLIIWLSQVCLWALLTQYDWFASDDGGGMNEIVIRIGDYEPQPIFLPTYTFARGVFLNAEFDIVFTTSATPITSSIVSGSFETYQG
ncbi:hypothetical protein SD70_02515 [Gordoniibacillus kamchatkensis]|uniref:Bacteriophage protein n=1 Tax=Gordoniibacillus kamchatkensis TaxID=1590651 RepID=A0ABR5AM37_9BACL|nr:hypothetical protein [Paenibacillus sp. VKM B-2647]KIL42076.1 hypothetical protein SD70_02515 [Paenibacillus sp. VKM B-2647]